jgi:UDP-N-acetylglucosamine--N-acetylmuramyl-(pentapeptide) pyrophosphoryl-undecaprenol N-acetylglucosamine transferase
VTFDSTAAYFGRRAFVAGNPVRPEFVSENAAPGVRVVGPPRLLIFGGSQGSHAINVAMVEAAPQLAAHRGGMEITHQTGERDLELVKDGYSAAGIQARVEPFLFAMEREIRAADLVVCRAGATTIAELTAAGRPAVLVPLPSAADDHQRKNAEVLAAGGAAEIVEQKHLNGAFLAERIATLLGDPARLAAMSAAARTMSRPDAARVIADKALALAGKG